MNVNKIYSVLGQYSLWILIAWMAAYFLISLCCREHKTQMFLATSVAAYIGVFLFVTLLGRKPGSEIRYRLSLLEEYRMAFSVENLKVMIRSPLCARQIANNILLFVPMGIFLGNYLQDKSFIRILVIGAAVSGMVEISQLLFRMGLFDLSDILNNSLGAILGYFSYCMVEKMKTLRKEKTRFN